MIADAALLIDGVRQHEEPLSLRQAQEALGLGGLVWVSLLDPDEEELLEAGERFGLHPVGIAEARDAHQRPKIQEYEDHVLLVLRTARYPHDGEAVEFGAIHVFVSATFVVSVRHGPTNSLRDALIHPQLWEPRTMAGAAATVWAILDRVIDDYEPVLAELERDIQEVERAVFEGGTDQTQRIYLLRRELADMHRTVRPLLEPLEAVERGDYMSLEGDTPLYFRALADHARRLHEEVVTQRYLLEGVLQANLASIGVRQNEVVRKVSGWVGIITLPTLIASVYGMNFERMPELQWAFGYPLVIALMVTCAIALWLVLRRVRWL